MYFLGMGQDFMGSGCCLSIISFKVLSGRGGNYVLPWHWGKSIRE